MSASFMCPDHLRFDHGALRHDTPSGLSVSQVIQRSLEAYMNGGRHGDAREPLADFIANELRLHGWDFGEDSRASVMATVNGSEVAR